MKAVDKLAQLQKLSWSINMKTVVALELSEKAEEEEWLKGYRKAQKHTAENLYPLTHQLVNLIDEIKKELEREIYMVEDVDLSGMEEKSYA